jgi:phage gpG-like protein
MSHVSVSDTDNGMQAFLKTMRASSGVSYTKVGLPAETEPVSVANGHSSTQADLVRIAAIHEFGAPNANIPERSFLRSTYDANVDKLKKIKDEESTRILAGQSTMRKSLGRIGEWMATQIKLKIKSNIPPALSEMTIAKKGSDVALIDSGQLIQSITHVEVVV